MSLPKLFISKIEAKLGDEAPEFFAALQEKPPISIRINPRKGAGLFPDDEVVPWCKFGRYFKERPSYVFDPLYHAGAYYAQEASSMLFANAIDFSKDMKVLDLCAAPGGKSSLLLSMMTEGSLLVSNELVGKRNSILQENLIKWGYPNVVITKNRADEFSGFEGFFDVVLVDAPCSGEGMFRKDEEAITQWSEGLVQQCTAIQDDILGSAIRLVKQGGLLIYSTCTFEEAENENHLRDLYSENGSYLEPQDIDILPGWGMKTVSVEVDDKIQKGYYCFPHKVKGEGLFVSAMRVLKNRSSNSGKTNKAPLRKATAKELESIAPFVDLNEKYSVFINDERVQIFPSSMEKDILNFLAKMEIRKAGIFAGILQRDVFIPEHDLAMSGLSNKEIPTVELTHRHALEYQQRQTMPPVPDLKKGWFLYTYNDLPIGWAKNIGNRINNHYPAEWRIRKALEKE